MKWIWIQETHENHTVSYRMMCVQ